MGYWKRTQEWYRSGYMRNPYRFAFGTMFAKSIIADTFSQLVLENNLSHSRKASNASSNKNPKDIKHEKKSFDFKRMLRFGCWGGLYCGFVEHWMYNVAFTHLWPQPILMSAFKKMMVDMFIHCPFLYFPVYYCSKALILGNTMKSGMDQYMNEWKTVNIECWKIWIPIQLALFYFVPIPFRLITMGIFSLFWMSYLSFLSPMIDETETSLQSTENELQSINNIDSLRDCGESIGISTDSKKQYS